MKDDLVQIYLTNDISTADLIKNTLEDNDINVILQQTTARSVYPITIDGMGEIKIMVLKENKEKAEEILKEGFDNLMKEEE